MVRDYGDAVKEMSDLAAVLLPLYLEWLDDPPGGDTLQTD
jgi:hypothetical protein